MKRIFAWQTDTLACHLYRTVYPFTHLNPEEWSYEWGHPGPAIHDYDVVVGQRIAGDSQLWRDLCKDPNVMAVYDLDDWLLGIDPNNSVPYSIYHPIEKETEENVRLADAVTVSTPKMAKAIRPINSNVYVLENCLHPDNLASQAKLDILRADVQQRFVVGWGGSTFHRQDWKIHTALREFYGRYPNTSFHMMGANYLDGVVPSRNTGFHGMDDYLKLLDFSVGLAPLSSNTFNDMKSWCKALEYASQGIPVVASKVGQYPDWVERSEGGLIVEEYHEWLTHLLMLRENPDVLLEMSRKAYAMASAWTIDKHVDRWDYVYSGGR